MSGRVVRRDEVAVRTEHSRSQADCGRNVPDDAASDHFPPVSHALHRPPHTGAGAAAIMAMALMMMMMMMMVVVVVVVVVG